MPARHDAGGAGLLRGELLAEDVGDLAALRAPRGAPGRRAARARCRGTGAPRNSSTAIDAAATGTGRRITATAMRCQKPSSLTVRRPLADREAVDAAAEGGEDRRQHDDGEDAGEDGDGHAGVGEAAQEGEGEHEQRAQRRRHGEGAEGTVRPAVRTVRTHGVVRLVAGAQLLAEAADDEQRVVDGEAEAHRGGEVEGEDRDLGDQVDEPQHDERADDRQRADGERQRRRHDAAEHEQQQDEGDRQGDHLGPDEVLLDRRADLVEDLGEAADADACSRRRRAGSRRAPRPARSPRSGRPRCGRARGPGRRRCP